MSDEQEVEVLRQAAANYPNPKLIENTLKLQTEYEIHKLSVELAEKKELLKLLKANPDVERILTLLPLNNRF